MGHKKKKGKTASSRSFAQNYYIKTKTLCKYYLKN
jgi:hypothetical protein